MMIMMIILIIMIMIIIISTLQDGTGIVGPAAIAILGWYSASACLGDRVTE